MFFGIVVRGDGIGRTRGFPTANIVIDPKKVKLKSGIYAAWTILHKQKYASALVIHSDIKKIEIHLIDYQGSEFYGESISVDPVQKVSEIESLTLPELTKKIETDVELVRRLLLH